MRLGAFGKFAACGMSAPLMHDSGFPKKPAKLIIDCG
jgi:hypothetical protein